MGVKADAGLRVPPATVDVLIIGAGPHGLAMASRLMLGQKAFQDCLCEWKEARDVKAHLETFPKAGSHTFAVVDDSGAWMTRWKHQFEALGIDFLRSHDEMHPDAFSHTSLSVWAMSNNRDDFLTLENLPQDRSWHGNFKAPSNDLMVDFCQHLVHIGHLEDRLWHAHVESLEPCDCHSGVKVHVTSAQGGGVVLARHVVVARGPTWCRQWPSFYEALDRAARAKVYHAWDLFDDPARISRIRGHCVIVGGGLTSAHLCTQLGKHCQIDLLIRRGRRVKQWDLDLSWMAATANRRQLRQQFEKTPLEDRAAIMKSVRDGGSITPEMDVVLSKLEAQGQVKVHEFTEIASASWDGGWMLVLGNGTVMRIDHLICATGAKVDISTDPLLANLQHTHPVRIVNGLPVLSENLQWGQLPIHLMGNMAALELGPDAVNMSGAVRGAFRIWPSLVSKRRRKKHSGST